MLKKNSISSFLKVLDGKKLFASFFNEGMKKVLKASTVAKDFELVIAKPLGRKILNSNFLAIFQPNTKKTQCHLLLRNLCTCC